MNLHETFQMHCQYCWNRFEGDSIGATLRKVQDHEKRTIGTKCPRCSKACPHEHRDGTQYPETRP